MRHLYLHIGAHKTGTTTLQHTLYQNRALLGDHGVALACAPTGPQLHAYLGPVTPGQLVPGGHGVLDAEGLMAQMKAARQDLVIASSENFSFFFDRAQIAALEALLRPVFPKITVVSYLRRQDRHAVSHHQEGAKSSRRAEGELWGHEPTALPDHRPEHALYLDYDRRMDLWAQVFGGENLLLRVYDRALLQDGDIVADFLSIIGLTIPDLIPLGDRNVSLGATQTKAGHLMNAAGLRPRVVEAILRGLPTEGRLLPSRAAATAYLDHYRASNRRLNSRFGISPLPDLFDDDMTLYPETAQSDWTDAGATAALRAVIAELSQSTPALQALGANDFRLAALALGASAPDVAQRMIHAAAALRPQGAAILRIKADLDRRNGG